MKTVLMGLLLLSTTTAFAQKMDCEVVLAINDGSGERKDSEEFKAKFEMEPAGGINVKEGVLKDDLGYHVQAWLLNESIHAAIFVFRQVEGKAVLEGRGATNVSLKDSAKFQEKGSMDLYTDALNNKFLNATMGARFAVDMPKFLAAADASGDFKVGDWIDTSLSCVITK